VPAEALSHRTKGTVRESTVRESTTLVVVATDAVLTKAQRALAIMAQTGVARAIYPVPHALDGDILFVAATGRKPLADPSGRSRGLAPWPPIRWPGDCPRHLRGGGAPLPLKVYQAGVTSSLAPMRIPRRWAGIAPPSKL